MDADKLTVKELMELYLWIPQKIQQLHRLITAYSSMAEELGQDALKAQILSDMPRGTGTSNPTQNYALEYQETIDEYSAEIRELRKAQKWLDKLRRELQGRDWEILYLSYARNKSVYSISRKLSVRRNTVDKLVFEAEERAKRILQ